MDSNFHLSKAKKLLTIFFILRYDFTLNGYSLIPSWWRDRPNETQQPATKKMAEWRTFSEQRC